MGQDKERLFECSACFYVFDIQAEQNNMLGNDRECPECGARYTLKKPENYES
jgi:rubredoxin